MSLKRTGDVKKTTVDIVMQTKTDPLMKALPRTQSAANGDFPKTGSPSDKPLRPRSAGWDPYEVWRTRVKVTKQQTAAGKSGRGA